MRISMGNLSRYGYQASLATLKSLRQHGALETVRRVARRFRMQSFDISGDAFDREFDIDTETIVPLWKLAITSSNRSEGIRYQSLAPDLIRQSIRSLPIDHSRFRFIDYGSGKGRVILIASEFPFHSVTGVEFSQELHEIAITNIAKHPCARRKGVQSICIDAAKFIPPAGPRVLFLFNPFGATVIGRVLDNLRRLPGDEGAECWVVYHNPVHAESFSQSGMFVRMKDDNPWATFRSDARR